MSSTNTQETVAVVVRDENDRPHAVLLEAGVNLQHGTGLYATPLSAEPEQIESWPNGTYYRAWADALAAPAPVSVEPCKTCAGSGCVPHPGNAGGVVACEDCRGGTDAPVSVEPPPAPDGWKLVPVEPTGEMLQALSGEWHSSRQQEARARYADMLTVAPVAAQALPVDHYQAGYAAACRKAADLAFEAYRNHVYADGLDGMYKRCEQMRQLLLTEAEAQAQPESAELREARHDSAHAETESERVRALAYWLEQQTYEPDMLSNAADTLRAYLEERIQAQPLPDGLIPTAPDLEYLRSMADSTNLPAFLRGQIAAAVKALATQAQPKRRPYNSSGSLSEYGVFPECDAQQPASGADGLPSMLRDGPYMRDGRKTKAFMSAAADEIERLRAAQPQPSGNAGKLPQSSGNPGQLDGGQVWDDAAMYRWLCDTAIRVQAYTAGPPNWLFRPMELRGITCDAAVKAARAAAKEQS